MPGTVAALLYVRRARAIGRDPALWTSSSTVATRPAGSVLTATSVMVPGRARPARTVDSSRQVGEERERLHEVAGDEERPAHVLAAGGAHPRDELGVVEQVTDRKSTRLNSSHGSISYAVFCLKKKTQTERSN